MVRAQFGNARQYLGSKAPIPQAARIAITFGSFIKNWKSVARRQFIDQQMATMSVRGLNVAVTMNSVWDGRFTLLGPGEYKVLLPDVPHNANMTSFYRDTEPRLHHDQVWFPIQHGNNSRYIHVETFPTGASQFWTWPTGLISKRH